MHVMKRVNASALVVSTLAILSAAVAIGQEHPIDLEAVDEMLKDAHYEDAISLTSNVIANETEPARRARAYVLIVKAYTLLANTFRSRSDIVTAELYENEARLQIRECLSTPSLRTTRPDPRAENPSNMMQLFREVRSETQGGIRLVPIQPSNATITLQGDTLTTAKEDSVLVVSDLPAGEYQLRATADGYSDLEMVIHVVAGTAVERVVALEERRGTWWWVRAAAAGAGGVGVLWLAFQSLRSNDEPNGEPGLLPPPPPPPAP